MTMMLTQKVKTHVHRYVLFQIIFGGMFINSSGLVPLTTHWGTLANLSTLLYPFVDRLTVKIREENIIFEITSIKLSMLTLHFLSVVYTNAFFMLCGHKSTKLSSSLNKRRESAIDIVLDFLFQNHPT